jgi:hypothetical protein
MSVFIVHIFAATGKPQLHLNGYTQFRPGRQLKPEFEEKSDCRRQKKAPVAR